MKAIRIHETGGPEVLRYEDVEIGEPGPGEVLVRHTAIGVNFIDTKYRKGDYPADLPVILGNEAAGVVEAVGDRVSEVAVGDRVAYGVGPPGADAEYRIMPPRNLIRLPDAIDDQTAAAMMLKGITAHYLAHGAYPAVKGETVLVQAAAGGVGTILCQLLSRKGVTIIGTVSSEEKAAEAAAHGCTHPVVYTKEDVLARVKDLTGGTGVDAVYDSVGKDTFETSLKCLRRRGMMVSFGTASGPIPPFDLFQLNLMGSLFLTSAGLADYTVTREEMLGRADELFALVIEGSLRIEVNQTWPLADAAEAHRALESQATTGSSVLIP
jgi:NADPH2:quinone reductase